MNDLKCTTVSNVSKRFAECVVLHGVSDCAQSDIPGRLFQSFLNAVYGLSDQPFLTLLRAAIMLIVCTVLCSFTLKHFKDSPQRGAVLALQWGCCLFGLFVALSLPIQGIHYTPASKAFVFLAAAFAVVVLPWKLASTLCAKQGNQSVLAKAILGLVAVIALLGFIF